MGHDLLAGKVAVITGAGDGFGLGISRAFYKEGARIAAIGRRQEKLDLLKAEIEAAGGECVVVAGDVGYRENCHAVVQAAVDKWGTVDILVTNAMAYNIAMVETTTDADCEKIIRSGFYHTLYCMQEVFPYMKAQGHGKIINFGSMAGLMGLPGHAAYSFVKEGIIGLTRTASLEWAQYNIQVNAVAPAVATPAWDNFVKEQSPEAVEAFLSLIPMHRMGDPETDGGRPVVFLASEYSNWITGRTLPVDGGQAMIR